MGEIIDKLKERYSWKAYLIACAIVNLGTLIMFVLMRQAQSLEEAILWFPVEWLMVFVLWVFFTEFLNNREEDEDE